jgi:predicted nuclease of predicted toxin-antitoxin system
LTLSLLFDQNVPPEAADFVRQARPHWSITHTRDLGLARAPDEIILQRAQKTGSIIITFDEDFADTRMFPVGSHAGVIRLRVWPTTVEQAISALTRLMQAVPENQWPGSLIIIDDQRIRVRHAARHG